MVLDFSYKFLYVPLLGNILVKIIFSKIFGEYVLYSMSKLYIIIDRSDRHYIVDHFCFERSYLLIEFL